MTGTDELAAIKARAEQAAPYDTYSDIHYLLDQVEQLRARAGAAEAAFDDLGPQMETLEKAKSTLKADNERLFQRLREEEALTVKWQQRARRAEQRLGTLAEFGKTIEQQRFDLEQQLEAAEAQLVEIAEVLTATNVASDFDDPVVLAHRIADYCVNHNISITAIHNWRGHGDGEE